MMVTSTIPKRSQGLAGTGETLWTAGFITIAICITWCPTLNATEVPPTIVSLEDKGDHQGDAEGFVENARPGFLSNASDKALEEMARALEERLIGHGNKGDSLGDAITETVPGKPQVIKQALEEGHMQPQTIEPTTQTLQVSTTADLSALEVMDNRRQEKTEDPALTPLNKRLNGKIDGENGPDRNLTRFGHVVKRPAALSPFILPELMGNAKLEKSSQLWPDLNEIPKSENKSNPNSRKKDSPLFDTSPQNSSITKSNTTEMDLADIHMLNDSDSVDEEKAPILKWNIQNDTSNSSFIPEIDETLFPIGKVCILLNGTVVKDMEEVDCKSNFGLHYKYVPSRLRNNVTDLNSTAGPIVYTRGPEEEFVENEGIDPEAIEGDSAPWEDAQWALYNENPDSNQTANTSSHGKGSGHSPLAPILDNLDISEATIPNPFGRNSSFAYETPSRTVNASYGFIDKNRGNETEFLVSGVFHRNHTNTNLSGLKHLIAIPLKNFTERDPTDNIKDQKDTHSETMPILNQNTTKTEKILQGTNYMDTHMNENDIIPSGKSDERLGEVIGQSQGKSNIDDDEGDYVEDNPKYMDINPKFIDPQLSPSTRAPQSVLVYHGRLHPIQGLIWEDRRYMMSVLIPVACGMLGAFLIVSIAYLSRYCPSRNALLKAKKNQSLQDSYNYGFEVLT